MDGIFVESNLAHSKTLATSKENIIGKNFAELYTYPPPYDQKLMEMFYALQRGEVTEPAEIEYITNEYIVHWESLLTTLVNIGGKSLILSIDQDITELKKVYRTC